MLTSDNGPYLMLTSCSLLFIYVMIGVDPPGHQPKNIHLYEPSEAFVQENMKKIGQASPNWGPRVGTQASFGQNLSVCHVGLPRRSATSVCHVTGRVPRHLPGATSPPYGVVTIWYKNIWLCVPYGGDVAPYTTPLNYMMLTSYNFWGWMLTSYSYIRPSSRGFVI